jgi:hypothetical protein
MDGQGSPAGLTIDEILVAAPAAAWESCGFAITAGVATVGTIRIRFLGGEGGGSGIAGWTLRGAESDELDGLPTELSAAPVAAPPAAHPNGALRVDHLVVFTPELKRTVAAFEGAGAPLRRVREPDEPGPPVRQAFFRLGEAIVEVVENVNMEAGPARFWGVTLRVDDLDACAELLGERLGEVHDAVQPGRRIATIRRDAGLGVPVALITT